ncbi:MAG: hypothetical protein EA377_00450 [Phycisphaerales bacterium]|nr:MAG: hypothetical protein EA377_00450 [Phycisphaerales bacterium]
MAGAAEIIGGEGHRTIKGGLERDGGTARVQQCEPTRGQIASEDTGSHANGISQAPHVLFGSGISSAALRRWRSPGDLWPRG